ncbi:MAG: septation ring formation regulator EzrA [Bacilli bacterium]|jgi:septation ring formation regulator, ezrA|uniref:septation ring formation regulator EzrA n=1 Tax=Candidatus Onthocola sp. TaxID=3085646 RepID=UPI002FAE5E96
MDRITFILIALLVWIVTIILVIVVLNVINNKEKKKLKAEIEKLEKGKNMIISASMLSELNKVEALVNNDEMKEKLDDWKARFNDIKDKDMPKITETINEIEELFLEKNFKDLKGLVLKADFDLNNLKTKASFLLDEIKDVTLSEERNRETITKLKAQYREILSTYKDYENEYEIVKVPLELQFENIEKLFNAFEVSMEQNAYTEVGRIVKAIADVIGNLKVIIEETRPIVSLGKSLIPKKEDDIKNIYDKMTREGYNLEYLNIDANIEEANKKIKDIFGRLNVLNVEDSLFELKTMHDYFDSLYADFDKERYSKKIYEDYSRSILIKATKLEKVNNELYKKIGDIKYSYDLTDDEVSVISEIKDEIMNIRASYDKVVDIARSKTLAYSKLAREMEIINSRLVKTEEKLNGALKTLGSLKEDELRAREQLEEIKRILSQTKEKIRSYKLPIVPKNYYVEMSEAMEAINELVKELDKRPISIKILNLRVDTARDLVLKVYNTVNETVKTAKMAETAIVYGNRYRVTNKEVDFGLIKAENAFFKGNFKNSLENAINAINIVEPGIHKKLLEESQS